MANIGSIAYQLTMDPSGFASGLEKAGKQLSKFGSAIPNSLNRHVNALSGVTLGPVSAALASFRQLATSIPLLGSAFAAVPVTGAEFIAFLKDGMSKVAEMAKLSDKTGVSMEALGGLSVLAGDDMEALDKGLFKLNNKLGEVLQGNEEAIESFAKLGLNARQLAQSGTEQAFKTIADRIRELPNAMERARAAQEIFSKGGQALLPILIRGSQTIDAYIEKAKQLGISLSRVDAEGVLLAQKALKETGHVIEGLKSQLALQLAPFIKAAADQFNHMAQSGVNMGELVASSIGNIALAIAYVSDGIKDLRGLGKILNAPIGTGEIDAAIKALVDRRRDADMVGKLLEDIKKAGNAAGQKSLAERLGPGKGTGLGAIADINASLDATQKLLDLGDKFTEKFATPAEKFAASIKEARGLMAQGAISGQTFARSILAAADALEKAQDKIESHAAPKAIEKGSAEDIATRAQGYADQVENRQERVAKILEQALTLQREQLKAEEATAMAIANLAVGSF